MTARVTGNVALRVTGAALALTLIAWLSFLAPNVYVLGGYVVAGWLSSPLVTYWLVGDHATPVSFLVRVYPRPLRELTVIGWYGALVLLTLAWLLAFVHVFRD